MRFDVKCAWDFILDIDTNVNIEVYIDRIPPGAVPKGVMRVLVLLEPAQHFISTVMMDQRSYTYLLTYHQDVLDNNPKARKIVCATTWIDPTLVRNKRFSVSALIGGKTMYNMPGYKLRHELWERREEITIPREFYLSSMTPYKGADYTNELVLGDIKEPLFDSMFHIAIENVYMRNCFSEKLIDCFLSRTIPIHFGTPNISDYFDTRGMFVCKTVDEMIAVCNGLHSVVYESRADAIEKNYIIAMQYSNFGNTLKEKIIELLKEFK